MVRKAGFPILTSPQRVSLTSHNNTQCRTQLPEFHYQPLALSWLMIVIHPLLHCPRTIHRMRFVVDGERTCSRTGEDPKVRLGTYVRITTI